MDAIDQVIKDRSNRTNNYLVSDDLLDAIRRVVEYNDTHPFNSPKRVPQSLCIITLREMGYSLSEPTLQKICQEHLKRKSYARK